MPEWNDELRNRVVKEYLASDPTPENSSEIVEEIAEGLGEDYTVNGVRAILCKSKDTDGNSIYKKKTAEGSSSNGESKTKRVNKADAIGALKLAIRKQEIDIDDDILGRLTGKAAVYFTGVINQIVEE